MRGPRTRRCVCGFGGVWVRFRVGVGVGEFWRTARESRACCSRSCFLLLLPLGVGMTSRWRERLGWASGG